MARGFLRDDALDALRNDIKTAIVTGEVRSGVPRSKTIEYSEMSQANFYKAWKRPELFRIGQLRNIYNGLRVPEEERRFV